MQRGLSVGHEKAKRQPQPQKRKSWIQRNWSPIVVGVLAGLVVFLVGEVVRQRKELQGIQNHRRELLNAPLAEIQSN